MPFKRPSAKPASQPKMKKPAANAKKNGASSSRVAAQDSEKEPKVAKKRVVGSDGSDLFSKAAKKKPAKKEEQQETNRGEESAATSVWTGSPWTTCTSECTEPDLNSPLLQETPPGNSEGNGDSTPPPTFQTSPESWL